MLIHTNLNSTAEKVRCSFLSTRNNKGSEDNRNGWKWAFWILFAIIVIPIVSLYLYLQFGANNQANSEPVTTTNATNNEEIISAEASLSTMSFNQLVETVIGGEDVPYQLTVDDQVAFQGTINVLGATVDYTMTGQPSVQEDGNIAIDVTGIDLAGISLPTETVLTLFQLTIPTDLPLQVVAGEEQIIIRLDQVSEDMDIAIKASEIDLENDEIEIILDVPLSYLEAQIEANSETSS